MDLFLLCEDQSYTLSRDNFWGLWPFLASSQSSTPQRAFWGLSCYLQVKVGIGFRLKLGWHRGLILVLNQRTEPKSVVYMPFPLCVLRCLCMLLPNFHLMSVYSTCAVRFVSSLVCVCLVCLLVHAITVCACVYCTPVTREELDFDMEACLHPSHHLLTASRSCTSSPPVSAAPDMAVVCRYYLLHSHLRDA